MKVEEVERIFDEDNQKLILTLCANADEVKTSANAYFARISQRDIPGFRKGKAPRHILEQSVGGHINAMAGVAEEIINRFAPQAIDAEGVIFISDPHFNIDTTVEEGKPFRFTVSGIVAPSMTLTSYDAVSIEMPPDEATEKEIESQIRELQDCYHSFERIEEDGYRIAEGDHVEMMLSVTNHGKPVSGLGKTSRMVGIGSGDMPPSFDAEVIGAKLGDELKFDFEAKNEKGESEYGDGNLHAEVVINAIRRHKLPDVDDELAIKVGCVDVADLRKQLELAINVQKSKDLPGLMIQRSVVALSQRLEGEVPEYYLDFIRQDVVRELMHSLESQGTNLQQWMIESQIDGEQVKDDIAQEALHRASVDCALEALFTEKGWTVTDEDIDHMFEGEGALEGTREDWKKNHRMADIEKMCRQSKASEWLVETAEVTVVEEVSE